MAPQHFQWTEEEMLDRLRALADGDDPPTKQEVRDDPDTPSFSTYRRRFGRYSHACELAGLDARHGEKKGNRYSDTELINWIRRLAANGKPPGPVDLKRDDRAPNPSVFRSRFGSWDEALEAAGYESEVPPRGELTRLIDEYVAEHGATPAISAIEDWDRITIHDYKTRFGSWRNALYTAGYPATSNAPAPIVGGDPLHPNGGREVEL